MKVLVVTSWYPTRRQPIYGLFIQEQVRILARNYDIAVIAPELLTIRTIMRHGLTPSSDLAGSEQPTPTVRPRVMSPIPGRPAFVAEPYARAVRDAYHVLEATWGRPDLIHAHVVLNAGFAAVRLGRELGVPVVLTEHASASSTWLKTIGGRDIVRPTLEAIRFHVAVSPSLAARIRRIAPVDVRVIGNVIDTDFFQPSEKPRQRGAIRLAFLGSLIPSKGAEILLRAAGEMQRSGTVDWSLRIAGDGPQRGLLRRLTHRLQLEDKVRFLGRLDRSGVRDLFDWSDFAVLPSLHETFGVVAAEAMAMGNPVIGFANGGFDYVVGSAGGVLVPVGDISRLTTALEDAVGGRLVVDRAASRRSIVERFGPDAFLEQISTVYADALGRPATAPGASKTG